jgi:hypothetical protein
MLIKTIAGVTLFALAGAAIGYSKVLCAGGECAITGTPYGGALFGGIMGLAVMSSVGNGFPSQSSDQTETQDEPETPKDKTK